MKRERVGTPTDYRRAVHLHSEAGCMTVGLHLQLRHGRWWARAHREGYTRVEVSRLRMLAAYIAVRDVARHTRWVTDSEHDDGE